MKTLFSQRRCGSRLILRKAKKERQTSSKTRNFGDAETERVPIRRHENTGTSAMELISFFIKERTDKVVLDLQEDLVTKNKDLIDTEAGKEARGQLAEGVEQTRRELEDTKAELREALRTRNKDMALKLSKERVD